VVKSSILRAAIISVFILITTVSCLNEPNVVFSSEIMAKINNDEKVRYDNVVVKGDLDFSILSREKILINNSIRITGSTIDGNVYFNNTIFCNSVNFERTTFKGCSAFKESEFKGNTYFNGVRFNGTANFEYAKFDRNANFWRSEFDMQAYFLNSDFGQNAFFIGAKFGGPAYFIDSTFKGDAYYGGSKFYDFTNFAYAKFNKNSFFTSSSFYSDTYFWYSEIRKNAFFDGAVFSKGANFNAVNFIGDASFNSCRFEGDAFFQGSRFERYLDLTLAKYDKIYIRLESINKIIYDDTAYQLLIENFRQLGLFADSNKCYYRYRIERRESLPRFYRPLDWMLMALYGYGTRPEFTLICAFIVIIISGGFFFLKNGIRTNKSELEPGKRISIRNALLFSAIYFTSGASNIISSEFTEFTPVGISRYIAVIERLSGWILFALFMTALANTVIR
jgi:hypothetical protein